MITKGGKRMRNIEANLCRRIKYMSREVGKEAQVVPKTS